MPYKVRKDNIKGNKDWAILKKENGKWETVGRSDTKKDAKASVRARKANE